MTETNPLPSSARAALKEWAVACEALGQGRQILLMRKGGISEETREFRIEHPEFLLLPTYEHQRPELLKENARTELARVLAERPDPGSVSLRYWSRVVEIFELTGELDLDGIDRHHIWSRGYALERLRWKPTKPLQLLALRVYRLVEPANLALRPEYGGCRSWLTLAEPVTLEGAQPVLSQTAFDAELDQIRSALRSVAGGVSAE